MRIHRIELTNFKKYAAQSFDLHPNFTLFIGDNGSGKTTVLDAIAVSLGIWLVDVPDSRVNGRNILPHEIRLEPERKPERVQFLERKPVVIRATGEIPGLNSVQWARQIREDGKRTTNADAKEVVSAVRDLYRRDSAGQTITFPIIAYYGAGRAWLPSNAPGNKSGDGPARRWNAFYDCLDGRIRFGDLREWFKREAIAAGSRGGQMRPGFNTVRQAVLNCVPGADELRFDADRDEPVLSIAGNECPLSNLSAGQSIMFAMAADIAIKMVTQNAALLAHGAENEVTRDTPGVVLIDELDLHLHPKWQRWVAADLKRTFPSVQFVCTSHSPQVIGEVAPEEIRVLDAAKPGPPQISYGADTNWLLDHVMHASSRNERAKGLIHEAEEAIEEDKLPAAKEAVGRLRDLMKGEDGDLVRLESSLETLEALERADH
jgi:predicted ATP-binding protein involved in virulence